jgi:hypothetical protein
MEYLGNQPVFKTYIVFYLKIPLKVLNGTADMQNNSMNQTVHVEGLWGRPR